MVETRELKQLIKKLILQLFPELTGYHQFIKAKVIKVYTKKGKVDDFNKWYAVDVQPLLPDGQVNQNAPEIHDVPIDVIWGADKRGIFCLPVKDAIVRVGYYYNDPCMPYIAGIIPDGYNLPEHLVDSIIIQQKDGVRVEIMADSKIKITTSNKVEILAGNTVDIDGGGGSLSGVVTKNCMCAFTGGPHPDYSVDVKASRG